MSTTESVCPVCLRRIAAERIAEGDTVYLRKRCEEHGDFKTVIWRGLESYLRWDNGSHAASRPPVCTPGTGKGCPFDCGLCAEHRQHTCCVVLEVTQRCNLHCPVCFASASSVDGADPSREEILDWCRSLLAQGGPFNIHLSGGEPTVRNDLPELIRSIRELGFSYIQLNTNGLRLAHDEEYAARLKQAGLTCVFLQFDGVSDEVFTQLRGRPLLETKLRAIENCGSNELGIVLVPTLVPGINTAEIGAILRTALRHAPTVRAVHFQPVSYFGRYPIALADSDRITIPEIIDQIEAQTVGQFMAANFYPASGENPYCSFHGKFWLHKNARIVPTARPLVSACCGPAPEPGLVQLGTSQARPGEGARRAQNFVARHWAFPAVAPDHAAASDCGMEVSSLDAFLKEDKHSFCISGMAFQDAWNLDLERLRECFLHVLSPEQKLVPLCAYNLTGIAKQTLYRPQNEASLEAGVTT